MNRSLSVSSTTTQVSPEVGVGLFNSTRTRSRSLNDLPGGLRIPLLKRPERLKPRIQATLAGLEELRLLKEQHRHLVDEAKFGLKTRSVSNSDMQDLFVKQTYEWLSSCRDRLSVSNLERISEESGKEEKNAATFECTRDNRESSDCSLPTRYRCQIKRPMSVSSYPTFEQPRRSVELYRDFKSNQQLSNPKQPENEKPFQPEKLTTMRRASFQCHVVLTKQKSKVPTMSASHEYPSPMHAVMRQYQSKIGEDKEKNDKKEPTYSNRALSHQTGSRESAKGATITRRSSFTDSNRVLGHQTGSRENAKGATITRRSSFTARSTSRANDENSLSSVISSPTRHTSDQVTLSSLHRRSIDTPSYCSSVGEDPSKGQTNKVNEVDVTGSISHRDPSQGMVRDLEVLRREASNQKCNTELEAREVTDSSQFGRTPTEACISEVSNLDQQVHNSNEKLPIQNSSKSERYSEYQNLKDLEQCRIQKTEPIPLSNPKQPDNQAVSPTQLSVTEKGKNLLNLKGDSCSYTSDEGYCASLSSTPSGRRQLSIQSDASWISADIEDNRSCDSNVISYKSGCSSHIAHGVHLQNLERKPALNRCKNSIVTPQKEKLHASKVLPFRQTSL